MTASLTITAGTNGTGNGKGRGFTVGGTCQHDRPDRHANDCRASRSRSPKLPWLHLKLSPKNTKLLAKGGAKTVRVTPNLSDCAWTAVSNSGFITITSGSTNILGKGEVSFQHRNQ